MEEKKLSDHVTTMTMRRKALEIKKDILKILKENGKMSIRALCISVGTNNKTIQTQIEELEYFEKVIIRRHSKNSKNGRSYVSVNLKNDKNKNGKE